MYTRGPEEAQPRPPVVPSTKAVLSMTSPSLPRVTISPDIEPRIRLSPLATTPDQPLKGVVAVQPVNKNKKRRGIRSQRLFLRYWVIAPFMERIASNYSLKA
jgi:hypothetical protein